MEVHQTCPRREAAASKLASGGSSIQAEPPEDILLGSAVAPLSDLLTKPQACPFSVLGTVFWMSWLAGKGQSGY